MSLVHLRNDALTVSIAAEAGARIAQLTDRSGHGWLVETDRPGPAYPDDVPEEMVDYVEGTRGGWDECLPSVAATSGNPGSPDHGDFWFRPWRITRSDERSASFAATQGPFQVDKTVTLPDRRATVRVELRVRNVGARRAAVLYSAHPLFRWPATATLTVSGVTEVRPGFGVVEQEPGERWRVRRDGAAANYKVFLRWTGEARLTFDGGAGAISLTCPDAAWLGVCVNRAAWPDDDPGEAWLALEPTTSPTDSLDDAVRAGTAASLEAGQSMQWTTTVSIEEASA